MPRSKARPAGAARHNARVETAEDELARLIREQREDQRQDRTGLRSTLLGECLRGVGVWLDDDLPRGSRRPSMDEQ
jgi:hypothetical protein